MQKFTRQNIIDVNQSPRSLWIAFVIDPFRRLIGPFILNYTKISPVQLSLFNLFCSIAAFYLFSTGTLSGFLWGGILAQIGFWGDSLDGTTARLKRNGSPFGALLDILCDLGRLFFLVFGFSIGLWNFTSNIYVFPLAMFLIFIALVELSSMRIINDVGRFYNSKNDWKMDAVDDFLLNYADKLAAKKLKLILFGFNEREAVVFFIGPLLGFPLEGLIAGIFLSIPFLILRYRLDIAFLKRKILGNDA
ncbi:MAG: CDP-alcohol phosphatidyltransferase family protein [Calditrichales bacterium]|nr:CDP-alcohol phosphatidyltransferase family protein [Calditrichales bacterium]